MLVEVMVLLEAVVEEFQLTFSVDMMTLKYLYMVRLVMFSLSMPIFLNLSLDVSMSAFL